MLPCPAVDRIEQRLAALAAVMRERHGGLHVGLRLARVEYLQLAEGADGLPVKAEGAHAPV